MAHTAPSISTQPLSPERAASPHVRAPAGPVAPSADPVQLCFPGLDADECRAAQAAAEVLGAAAARKVGGFVLPIGFRLSVLMPVYNERETVVQIIERVRSLPVPMELIVVDDGSTDGTRQLLEQMPRREGVKVMYHERNRGKGAALRTALTMATGDVAVIQDADLEYDPQECLRLLEPIVAGRADVVFGSRYLADDGTRRKCPGQSPAHRLANRLLTWLSNVFTGLRLSDMETCYKMFRRSALAGVQIEQDRFGVEPELTAKIARRGCRLIEMPIAYTARDKSQGKKIRLRDAFNAVWCIVRYSCL
ncbi:MAG TPA: glycosyltransferase family 2 protein [Pirellulales bacterium]|nr:glycosyltransferase family 2 protein [Pirellulales bacterium]